VWTLGASHATSQSDKTSQCHNTQRQWTACYWGGTLHGGVAALQLVPHHAVCAIRANQQIVPNLASTIVDSFAAGLKYSTAQEQQHAYFVCMLEVTVVRTIHIVCCKRVCFCARIHARSVKHAGLHMSIKGYGSHNLQTSVLIVRTSVTPPSAEPNVATWRSKSMDCSGAWKWNCVRPPVSSRLASSISSCASSTLTGQQGAKMSPALQCITNRASACDRLA